jgi:ABC-2 type transport system ATP-binding protein
MIEVKDLVKSYGNFKALDGVSFSVKEGEILGFLGPNGAGKTTLMRILTCYLSASSGQALVAGFDCETQSDQVRRFTGYLPENVPLYTEMKVREFLDFCADAKGIKGNHKKQAVDLALAETGTDQVAGRLISQLSKGYRQRTGLAQALLGDPKVLVLDEPTVGLDPRQIADIRSLIKSLAGRRTIILSTHILPEVSMVCDQVVIINKGKVIEQDTTANLSKKLSKSDRIQIQVKGPRDQIKQLLSNLDKVKKVIIKEEPDDQITVFEVDTHKGQDLRSAIAKSLVQKNWELQELRYIGLALEDIFLQLVTRENSNSVEKQEELQ